MRTGLTQKGWSKDGYGLRSRVCVRPCRKLHEIKSSTQCLLGGTLAVHILETFAEGGFPVQTDVHTQTGHRKREGPAKAARPGRPPGVFCGSPLAKV